jgi:hypothetical protein
MMIKDNTLSLSEQQDKDINESIAYAEQKLSQKMEINRKTPGQLFEGVPSSRIDSKMIS